MLSPQEVEDLENEIMVPFTYAIQRFHARGVKTKIVQGLNHWFQVTPEKLQEIGYFTKQTSVSIVVLDDIQDNSKLRNGHKTAHEEFGVPKSLLACLYQGGKLMQQYTDPEKPELIQLLFKMRQHFIRAGYGQGMDIYWRDNFICPSFEDYEEMVVLKTGAALMPLLNLLENLCENGAKAENYENLFNLLGLFFQIDNDLDSLTSEEFMTSKGFCEDITEGKFSYPIIHAIRAQPEDKFILKALKQRTTDIGLQKKCVALMEQLGSFEAARKRMLELEIESRREIERLGGNPIFSRMLDVWHGKHKLNEICL